MKIKNKFLIVFLFLSIIPILLITSFTYMRYTKLIHTQTTQVAENVFEKAVTDANVSIENIQHINEIFNFYSDTNDSIIDDLKRYRKNDGSYTSYDIFKSNQNIKFICKNLIYSSEYINGIFLFTPSGVILGYGYGNIDVTPDYNPVSDAWYQETLAKEGHTYISDIKTKPFLMNSQESVSFSKAIYDVYTHDFLGVLFIDCSPSIFNLSEANSLPDSISLSIKNLDNDSFLYQDSLSFDFDMNSSLVVSSQKLELDNLILTSTINYQKLYSKFNYTKTLILIISITCILISTLLSILLSIYLTRPISILSDVMSKHTPATDDKLIPYFNRKDEIGVLYNEYSAMIQKIKTYIQQEYQNKLITLDSQMRSLESQINSHFLYNTLESINSIAELEEVESISTMSLALGHMFRYSIKTKSELVYLEEEIQHVDYYLSIQRIRFDHQFIFVNNIPPSFFHLKVLKLILQPLIENALYHGLNYCHDGNKIQLDGYIINDSLYIKVIDNGLGLSVYDLENLRDMLDKEATITDLGKRSFEHIGIKNIHSRIELYYGKGYGINLSHNKPSGTIVTIHLPLISMEES